MTAIKVILSGFVLFVIYAVAAAPDMTPEQQTARTQARATEHAANAAEGHATSAKQFCQDSVAKLYGGTGHMRFEFGGTVYKAKGYGAIVGGNATTDRQGPIRFKCTFDNRSGEWVMTPPVITPR